MRSLTGLFRAIVVEDQGLETVEYAIVSGLIVAGTIAAIGVIGGWVLRQFQALGTALGL